MIKNARRMASFSFAKEKDQKKANKREALPVIRAVIFDLDGTLLDTLDDLAGSVNAALHLCGYPPRTRDEVRSFIGDGVRTLIRRSAPRDIPEAAYERCFALFQKHYLSHMTDQTRVFDGILPLLDDLRRRGVKIAVVSNKLQAGVVGLCSDFFGSRIDCAVGVTDESERKPAPVNVLRVMEQLGVSPDETLCVGDSEVDVQTAQNAGVRCVGVTWGYRTPEALKAAGAWRLINQPEELRALLDS